MTTVELLKNMNSKGFFICADLICKNEVIVFSNDKYSVKIDDVNKVIFIGRKENLKFPIFPNKNRAMVNIYSLAEFQKQLTTGIDYKEFKKIYVREILNEKPNFFNVRKISNEKVDEMIKDSESYMEEYKPLEKKWLEEKRNYTSTYKEDAKFLLSIQNEINELKKKYVVKTDLSSKFYEDMVEVLSSTEVYDSITKWLTKWGLLKISSGF